VDNLKAIYVIQAGLKPLCPLCALWFIRTFINSMQKYFHSSVVPKLYNEWVSMNVAKRAIRLLTKLKLCDLFKVNNNKPLKGRSGIPTPCQLVLRLTVPGAAMQ